jgi:hypothetical protein
MEFKINKSRKKNEKNPTKNQKAKTKNENNC